MVIGTKCLVFTKKLVWSLWGIAKKFIHILYLNRWLYLYKPILTDFQAVLLDVGTTMTHLWYTLQPKFVSP